MDWNKAQSTDVHKEQTKHRVQTCTKHKHAVSRLCFVSCALFVICVLGFVSFFPRVALADPHAVFYTAIGQQQLFYNVLAALDQADYVETQYAREQLVEKRAKEQAEPPFRDEEFPLTEATKVGQETTSITDPGIADILTRLITLEGTDLYNDQLVREFGAESGRRNSTSELLRTLCDYGLGLKDCEFDTTGKTALEIAQMENVRKRAVVKDPLDWASMPFFEGVVGALSSGLAQDEALRAKRLSDPSDPRANIPRAYSAEINKWRNEAGSNVNQLKLLEDLLVGVASDYVLLDKTEYQAEYPYKDITFSSGGVPKIYSPGGGEPTAQEVTDATQRVLLAPLKAREIADEAAARVALQQQMIENEGLLGDVELKRNPVTGYSNNGELSYLVKNPVAVKKADVYSLPNALALLDTSQQASSLAGLDKPGNQQLVERSSQGGSVQGLQSMVAGTGLNLFGLDERYDNQKSPTSPSANLIAGHLEQGAVQALRALTAGNFRKTPGVGGVPSCGYTCY